MVSQTNEQALEATIEKALTGTCQEEPRNLIGETALYVSNQLYQAGKPTDFNKQYALDEHFFWQFLQNTQAKELEKIKRNNPADWQRKIYERFDRLIKKNGVLHLLKKGLSIDDATFTLFYTAPLVSSSDSIKQNFANNIFSCTRQLRYSQSNPLQEIDMVLFINGIPLITIELKNLWTGQTARFHGQKQYKEDRDTNESLLNFGRCLVHMAVDTEEVYMTTKLDGEKTYFLPFNKGFNEGQGNPPNPNGHKTAYLWEEVFTKESLANIIQHFVKFGGTSKDPLNKRTLFFPRYHQMDVVRKLIAHASKNGVGQTYLIQHSAGSGKSNSITWAAYQLIEVYPADDNVRGSKGLNKPLFDSVIVVTDRRLLDKQIRENIKEFAEVKNIVAPAQKSSELKAALENGKKIIITTIQKFPFILDGISDLSNKHFAVIIDEAHSSQSGDAHGKMNAAMGKEDQDAEDTQDKILLAMKERKMRGNASYLAFTATPKNSTLNKFGQEHSDGSFHPFHLYSMKQAIEEGFILDVLANYTTYKSYYEIQKSIEDNPEFDTKKAQSKLRAYVEKRQQTIDVKAEVMLNHFIPQIFTTKKLKGKAKGMIVTQDIETAIRYHKAVTRILTERGNPFKAAIAFSGEKTVDGTKYTEADINGFPESDTKDYFDVNYKRKNKGDPIPKHINQDEYRLLIVANKYLTGFDQPKLCAMYVDKKLASVLCVQTLSRLNRSAPKWGKRTEDLFVLDFFNTIDDIQKSFEPFYTSTSLSKATDVNVLHELKDELDNVGVYEWHEVEEFIQLFFTNVEAGKLSPLLDMAAARFNQELGLEQRDKADFKIKAKQFVKIYMQVASIISFEIVAWEKLYWFLKFLIPKLIVIDPDADKIDDLLNSVDLDSYGLERVKLGHSISLSDEEGILKPQNPNPRGVHDGEKQTDLLDEIIRTFNERWFQGWNTAPEDQRVRFIKIVKSVGNHPHFESRYKNNSDPHHRELAFDAIFKEIMLEFRKETLKANKEDLEFHKLYAKDEAFKTSLKQSVQQVLDR